MCGVIGIWGNGPIIRDLYQGLLAIQHRGQDSAGVITFDGRFHTKKGNGLVHDIFTPEAVESLRGPIGVGHTRYPTIGGGGSEDAQPFQLNSPFGIIMAHNGNVANYRELRDALYETSHRLLNSDCDVEIILNLFAESLARERTKDLAPEHIFKAVEAVFKKVHGGYSVVAYIAGQGLVAFRDPFGIKPLVYGVRRDGLLPSYAFASETVSLNIMGFGEIRDVEAGEVVFIDKARTLHRKKVAKGCPSPCLFEWVYFARPDTFIDKVNVYKCRVNLGRSLAEEIRRRKLAIDVVVPVPDSARDAAIEIARKLGLKYSEALVKNRYIGRTFIMPADKERKSSVRQKLNPIASEIKGKKVLLVDDSIVRGNSERAIGAHGGRSGSFELGGAFGGRIPHDGEVAPGERAEGHGDEDGQGGDDPDAAQGRQGLAQVVLRLDDEDVDAAGGQAVGLLGESADEIRLDAGALGLEELPRRADAPGDKPSGRGGFAGEPGRGQIDLADAGLEPVGGQLDPRPAEAVGRDDVGAGGEIGGVDLLDGLRPADVPELGDAPPGESAGHELGSQGAVEEDRTGLGQIEQAMKAHGAASG